MYVCFVIGFFPSLCPWDNYKCGISQKSAAMLQCHSVVRTLRWSSSWCKTAMMESKGHPGKRETKEITISNDVSSLFSLFSLCVFCSPAWWYCTTWMSSSKGPPQSLIPDKFHCYTLYSLSIFSLAKSAQIILEICAIYRLVSYLLADDWLICRLRTQCQIGSVRRCICCYLFQNNV